jgi:two-component sensor histidine kinase
MVYMDNGIGMDEKVELKEITTLCLSLVTLLTQQLKGQFKMTHDPDHPDRKKPGMCFMIIFPA